MGWILGPSQAWDFRSLNLPFDPAGFKIHAVHQTAEGTRLVVRGPRILPKAPDYFTEYEIDLAKRSAIVRTSAYAKGRVFKDQRVDWELTDGFWQPRKWSHVVYGDQGELENSNNLTCLLWTSGAEAGGIQFTPALTAGQTYYDVGSRTAFVKGKVGEPDVPLALHQVEMAQQASRWRWWAVAAVAVGVAILGQYWRARVANR